MSKKIFVFEVEIPEEESGTPLEAVVGYIASLRHWSEDNVYKYIKNLAVLDEKCAADLVLKYAALLLDDQHEDHIKNADEVWAVADPDDHMVYKTNPEYYEMMPLFRTKEEAEFGIEAVEELFDEE